MPTMGTTTPIAALAPVDKPEGGSRVEFGVEVWVEDERADVEEVLEDFLDMVIMYVIFECFDLPGERGTQRSG